MPWPSLEAWREVVVGRVLALAEAWRGGSRRLPRWSGGGDHGHEASVHATGVRGRELATMRHVGVAAGRRAISARGRQLALRRGGRARRPRRRRKPASDVASSRVAGVARRPRRRRRRRLASSSSRLARAISTGVESSTRPRLASAATSSVARIDPRAPLRGRRESARSRRGWGQRRSVDRLAAFINDEGMPGELATKLVASRRGRRSVPADQPLELDHARPRRALELLVVHRPSVERAE